MFKLFTGNPLASTSQMLGLQNMPTRLGLSFKFLHQSKLVAQEEAYFYTTIGLKHVRSDKHGAAFLNDPTKELPSVSVKTMYKMRKIKPNGRPCMF